MNEYTSFIFIPNMFNRLFSGHKYETQNLEYPDVRGKCRGVRYVR